jgi:S1-C subfamily serine protease
MFMSTSAVSPPPLRFLPRHLFFLGLVALLAASPASAAPPTPAGECSLTLPQLYDKVSPSVVSVTSASINPYGTANQIERHAGSGVIVDSAGLILTNSHVVFGRQLLTVTLDDGTALPARVVGADPVFDIAFLKIPPPTNGSLPVARLGNSDGLRVGDEVYAIGNPFGLEQTLTRGIVSAVNRVLPGAQWSLKEPLIQTDAAINPGNSGGPLVNGCGDVVGLTTAILPEAQSIGFAIPASLISSVSPDLLKNGRVVRPWVGVQGTLVSPALRDLLRVPLAEGLLVEIVEPGSPAAGAGVHGGDLDLVIGGEPLLVGGEVITAINGASVGAAKVLAVALSSLRVGERVALTLARGGETRTLDLVVGERPFPHQEPTEGPFEAPLAGVARPAAGRGSRFAPGGRQGF